MSGWTFANLCKIP